MGRAGAVALAGARTGALVGTGAGAGAGTGPGVTALGVAMLRAAVQVATADIFRPRHC